MKILSHCTCAFTNCDILDTSLTEAGSVMGIRNSEFERAWGPDQYIPKKKKHCHDPFGYLMKRGILLRIKTNEVA
jgi:hypothetical protein